MRILAAILVAVLAGCGGNEAVLITGNTMGTTYSVKLVADSVDSDDLKRKIDAELVQVNDVMSTYIEESEISRFNAAEPGTWFPVSQSMVEVVRLAGDIHEASGGRFDVTVGPLVNLWGFGPTPADLEVPPDEEIEAAMARVGMEHLAVRDDALKRDADIYLDLSAIAKGYGVDRIASLLETEGFGNYLVEIGGELRAKGNSPRGTPWRLAIERPDTAARVPFATLEVRDAAIATSGDYRNYFEVDGRRYSHMIDPVTGRPITHRMASVSVLAPTAAEADGLATALYVMGPEAGFALAERRNIPVFAIIKTEDGFVERHSTAFEAYIE